MRQLCQQTRCREKKHSVGFCTMPLALFSLWLTLLFLVIQPCLGFGFAASKTPTPWKARFLSTLAHLAYGLGLFITAFAIKGVSQYFM